MAATSAADLIAAAEAATTEDELDNIETLAEGRVTVLDAVEDARARLEEAPVAEATASLSYTWVWNTQTTAPAGNRQVRTDTGDWASAVSLLNISNTDTSGLDHSAQLDDLNDGDQVRLEHGTDPTRFGLFTVTGPSVADLAGNSHAIPVAWADNGGTLPNSSTQITVTLNIADSSAPVPVPNAPDFVWVGHADGPGACWTPKDSSRPVMRYVDWLADGYRHLTYICMGCGQEVHGTLWGFYLEDAKPWREGGLAAIPTEVMVWGR